MSASLRTPLKHPEVTKPLGLPSGWRIVRLADVADQCLGKMLDAKKNRGRDLPYLRNPNVRWFETDLSDLKEMPFEDHELERYGLRRGDVLICEGGEAGRAAIWESDQNDVKFQKAIHRIRPGPELYNRFLVHRLCADYENGSLAEYYTGATIKHLTGQDLARYEFPLPPLAEQRRIADMLDRVMVLQAQRRQSLAALDELERAILLELVGDPVDNPRGWSRRKLSELATKIGSGATPTGGDASYKSTGTALIRSLNVRDGSFSFKDLARIDDSQAAKLAGVVVECDDVLLNITGASVARVCRAPASVLPARVNQHVSIVRSNGTIAPLILEQLLRAPSMKAKLLQIAEIGATRQAITKRQIEDLEVPVPPLDVQREALRRLSTIAQLRRHQADSAHGLRALFLSLQDHALKGEI